MKSTTVRPGVAAWVLGVALLSLGHLQAATLEECIALALRNNPDVRAAADRIQAAHAAIKEAQSAYYPMAGASATYARTDNPPQAFMMLLNQQNVSPQADFNHPGDTENLALSLGLKYRLLDFGRRSLDNRMAEGGADISRLVLQGLQNELIHQVTRGYYSILQAAAFVGVREEAVKTLEESLRVANERLKAGGAVKTDALHLEVQLAQANEDLIRARHGVRLSIAALNAAMGTNAVSAANMPASVDRPGAKPPDSEDGTAVRNRPEFEAARRVADVQRAGVRKANRQYWPTVNAFGSVDWNSDVSSDFAQSYVVGVAAEMDLFDGFRRSAAADGARAQERAAEAVVEKAANDLRLDLTSASLQASEAWERLDVARKSVESSEEALRITRERYQQGAADIPELLTAQVGLTGTRTRNVAALYDCLIARSNLERARGELVGRYVKAE